MFPLGIEEVGRAQGTVAKCQPTFVLTLMLLGTASTPNYSVLFYVTLSRYSFKRLVQSYSVFPQGIKEVGRAQGTYHWPANNSVIIDALWDSLNTQLFYIFSGHAIKIHIKDFWCQATICFLKASMR